MQLRRDALPALEAANVGLAVVGIGSLDAGETFASRTEFPKSMLYVDDSDESETYRAAGTRNTKRKPDGKADFEGIGSMWSQATNDALKIRGKKDLDAITGSLFKPGIYTPLMPKGSTMTRSMEKTMVQGGSFVFEGDAVCASVRPSVNPIVASRRWRGASHVLPRRSSSSTTTSPRALMPGSTTSSKRPAPRSHRVRGT